MQKRGCLECRARTNGQEDEVGVGGVLFCPSLTKEKFFLVKCNLGKQNRGQTRRAGS